MLHTPLLGHLAPSKYTHKLPTSYKLTEKERERYYFHYLNHKPTLEPSLTVFKKHIMSSSYPLPPLKVDRERTINTLPFAKFRIGHRNPLPSSLHVPTTYIYIVDGHQAPQTPTGKYPNPLSHDAFIELIRFWDIALLDALDYLLWEHKRTNGMKLVDLDHGQLPRTPEVLDWMDAFTGTRISKF